MDLPQIKPAGQDKLDIAEFFHQHSGIKNDLRGQSFQSPKLQSPRSISKTAVTL